MANIEFDNIKLQFEKFLSLVGNVLAHETKMNVIQNKLRRHFNTTSSSYLCSADFQSLLDKIQSLFKEKIKLTKYFALLASFDEQLKKHSIKLSGSYRSSREISNSTHNNESVTTSSESSFTRIPSELSSSTTHKRTPSTSIDKQVLDSCNQFLFELNEELPMPDNEFQLTTDSANTSECELKRDKKIRKLERRLTNLSKTIRELEEQDMSLDEMEHSDLYLVESNLKRQAYEIFTKLAELKNQSASTERILHRPVTLSEIDICHPLINRALEDMVNKRKSLPSFDEVLRTVEKTNGIYELNLSADARKNLAENSFKAIGKQIKNRRMADFNDIMNSRLPEDFDIEENDPAINSSEIETVLLENERAAVIKTEKIFEEFSQIDPGIDIDSTNESDDEGKGEEEEVEIQPEMHAESSDNKYDETHYDIVDMLPPFSPKSSTPSPTVVSETENQEDRVDTTVEFSFNDRTLTILSTASIPIKRITRDPYTSRTESGIFNLLDDNDIQQSQSIAIVQEHIVETIIPRRRHHSHHFCKKRLATNGSSVADRRWLSKDVQSSKYEEDPEIVVLD